jgi:hypothetical protein
VLSGRGSRALIAGSGDRRHLSPRAPFVVLRARQPPWPESIIGPPRPGDNRTPLERWKDFHFAWEAHFYG